MFYSNVFVFSRSESGRSYMWEPDLLCSLAPEAPPAGICVRRQGQIRARPRCRDCETIWLVQRLLIILPRLLWTLKVTSVWQLSYVTNCCLSQTLYNYYCWVIKNYFVRHMWHCKFILYDTCDIVNNFSTSHSVILLLGLSLRCTPWRLNRNQHSFQLWSSVKQLPCLTQDLSIFMCQGVAVMTNSANIITR